MSACVRPCKSVSVHRPAINPISLLKTTPGRSRHDGHCLAIEPRVRQSRYQRETAHSRPARTRIKVCASAVIAELFRALSKPSAAVRSRRITLETFGNGSIPERQTRTQQSAYPKTVRPLRTGPKRIFLSRRIKAFIIRSNFPELNFPDFPDFQN